LAGVASCVTSFIAGRLTKSDTFLVAMVIATMAFLVLRLRTWLTSPEHKFDFRFALAVLAVIAVGPLSVALAPYAIATADDTESFAISLTKDRGGEATQRTAALRIRLWRDALYSGLETGSVGLGPGPHLERPNVPIDPARPALFEAHNMLLDVFTQGGLVGVLAVCALFANAFVLLSRAKLDALAALIATLAVFSITHFFLRQPIVWFALAYSLILGSACVPTPRTRNGADPNLWEHWHPSGAARVSIHRSRRH
jgi:O-antigen ligase